MDEPSRIEKMVGELLGLRMLVAGLLQKEIERSGAQALETTRSAALSAIESWPVGSDTADGAERIRRCAHAMLTAFPAATTLA